MRNELTCEETRNPQLGWECASSYNGAVGAVILAFVWAFHFIQSTLHFKTLFTDWLKTALENPKQKLVQLC